MFKLTVGVCVLVALLAGWLFFERARAQAALRQYERQLLARGEKLTFAEVTPPLPDGENRAVELANLSFQNGVVLPSHSPPVMRCIAPGKAWVVIGETEWFKEGIGRFTWQQLAEDLERNREVLDQLRAAVRSPVLRYPLHYRGISTLLPHRARQIGFAQRLSGSALYKIHTGDIQGAVDDIEAIVNLARLAEDEATLISQLVRLAILAIAVDDCWPLLQCPRLPDSELARLQQIFERVDPITSMVLGLRGERAMGRDTVAIVRSAEIEIKDIVGQGGWFDDDQDPPQAIEKLPYGEEMLEALRVYVLYPAWRFAFSYADEKQLLVQMQSIIDGARAAKDQKSAAPLHSLDKTLRTKTAPGGELRSWRYLVTSLTVPHNARAASRAFRVKTQCNMAVTAIALKRYHLRYQKYPASLLDLVPEFISEVPIDYMDGKPMRYRVDGSQFVLWSVGNDGVDDAGTPNSKATFNWLSGPDIVWPQPASPEEVKEYLKRSKPSK